MNVRELAESLGVPSSQIIRVLAGLGELKTPESALSPEEVELLREELGFRFHGSR